MKTTNSLLNSVRQCLAEPVYDVQKNFSLEKSKGWYEKRKKQWDSWGYKQNPAVKKEEVSFDFGSLSELWLMTTQAHNLYVNLKKEDFNKWVDWCIYWQNIVVSWYRLKSFDEWLHDWLKDAIIMACDCPEDWARMIIERELWEGRYTNTAIHMYAEWKIDEETLKRLWQYEPYHYVEWLDIEEAIEKCIDLLWNDAKESDGEKNVTVLTFKLTEEWIKKL